MEWIGFLLGGFITIMLIIPFLLLLFYFIIGWRQVAIGSREGSEMKKRGGRSTVIVSGIGMLLLILLWFWLLP